MAFLHVFFGDFRASRVGIGSAWKVHQDRASGEGLRRTSHLNLLDQRPYLGIIQGETVLSRGSMVKGTHGRLHLLLPVTSPSAEFLSIGRDVLVDRRTKFGGICGGNLLRGTQQARNGFVLCNNLSSHAHQRDHHVGGKEHPRLADG